MLVYIFSIKYLIIYGKTINKLPKIIIIATYILMQTVPQCVMFLMVHLYLAFSFFHDIPRSDFIIMSFTKQATMIMI